MKRVRTALVGAGVGILVMTGCGIAPQTRSDATSAHSTPREPRATRVPTPTPPPPTTVPTTVPPVYESSFPGDVAPGFVRWGAAIGGNADPARHESVTANPMGIRRTYFGWRHRVGYMISTASDDLDNGRLPWVSIKTPGWAEMASGARDAEIDEMLVALDGLGGPVWLTVHHQPEGGDEPGADDPGGAPAWRAMQIHIRERMDALGTANIAFAPVLMSWTFVDASQRNPADWWVDGIWDFAGINHYVEKEPVALGTDQDPLWTAAYAFYSDKGMKVALGEWGNRGVDQDAAADMGAFYQLGLDSAKSPMSQIIGLSYFDSNLDNATGGWELQGEPLAKFRQLMDAPTSLTAAQDGVPPTPPTTTTVPPTPPTTVPPVYESSFPGDVAPGFVRWGAAIGGNADPARHESVTANPMGIRRTYFGWRHRVGYMISTASDDLDNGRLPWVSIKTPGWAEMASGERDAEIDAMLGALDELGGPIWLTVHHEPEGGGGKSGADDPGGAPAWRAMQIHIRERMDALGTANIAFAPVLMSWTFVDASHRNPGAWWVDGIWDFAGIDHYVEKEKVALATDEDPLWTKSYEFYSDKGIKVAIGEWANRGVDQDAAADMHSFYRLGIKSAKSPMSQIIGFAYFDSNLNSPKGGYELKGKPLAKFRQLMDSPKSLTAAEDGGN